MRLASSLCLSPVRVAAHGAAYLLTQRSWTSRIGTGFRKCSFSRPRFFVTTSPAPSSTRRCFMTPKRVIGSRRSSAPSVCPSCLNSSSSSLRRDGAARARNTASTVPPICDSLVTYVNRLRPGGRAQEFQELGALRIVSISRCPVRREDRAQADRRGRAREGTLSTHVAPALFSSPLVLLSEGARRAVRERHGLRASRRRSR